VPSTWSEMWRVLDRLRIREGQPVQLCHTLDDRVTNLKSVSSRHVPSGDPSGPVRPRQQPAGQRPVADLANEAKNVPAQLAKGPIRSFLTAATTTANSS
jgi:hypothetical protein